MTVESNFNYPSDLNASYPDTGDNPNEGDNHVRGIKNVLKTTFPNVTGAVTATQAELNLIDGSSAGTVANSKAVIYGAAGEVNATTLQIGGVSVTASAAELNLIDTAVAGTIVNSKAVIYGSAGQVNATTLQIGGNSITATAAEINKLAGLATTAAELGYVNNVTSAIQTQIDGKAAKAKTISAKSDDFTAAVGYHYFMTASGKTCTFPSGSAYGDEWSITHNDGVGTITDFALGSEKFCGGTTAPGTISARVTKTFRYTNATYGWVEV